MLAAARPTRRRRHLGQRKARRHDSESTRTERTPGRLGTPPQMSSPQTPRTGRNPIGTDDQPGLVIHVSSGADEDLRTALRYATNFAKASDENRRVDVVVNGAALDLVLADGDLREQVSDLHASGSVEFSACANTMAARGIGPTHLHPAAHIVTAAVPHLARRQWAGWAYLRP